MRHTASSFHRPLTALVTGGGGFLGRAVVEQLLARGDRVELRGFGAFSAKQRGARVGRNPRTGASVQVSAKYIPYFKSGKQLRERLNAKP